MCTLFLIRHGQTDWNKEKRFQGSKDIPLNERGRSQARELSNFFKEIPLAGIYASTLSRAYETAELIKGDKELVVETFDALKERSFGELEGKLTEEIHKTHPNLSSSIVEERLYVKVVPSQESYHEVASRVIPTLKMLGNRHLGENIAIVTHGGVIRTLLLVLEAKDYFVNNCEVVTFLYKQEKLTRVY